MLRLFGVLKGLLVQEGSDRTKELSLEVDSGATTGTRTTISASQTADRTVTIPDATDTLVGKATIDTLTNKTIDADFNTVSNLAHGAEVDDPSSGVHGVAGSVVGTSDAQSLTNKTIVVASNTITTAASGNLTSTELDSALAELQTDVDTRALSSDLTTHISDTTTHGTTGDIVGTSDAQALTSKTIDADLNTISNLAHGAEVDNPSSGVHGVTGSVVGTSDAQSLTSKTIDADLNTISNLAHGAEVDNPSSGVHGVTGSVVGTSDTQDLSNKTFTDAITLEEQVSTPSNPASGDKKIYAKNDGKLYTLNSLGEEVEVGSGAGQGSINYIENSQFETNTDGWSTYDDGSVAEPIDGTGGVPGITIANNPGTAVSPRGSFALYINSGYGSPDRQGEGFSYDFSIDNADQYQDLLVSFDYRTNKPDLDAGEIRAFIYDIDNATLIGAVQNDDDGNIIATNNNFAKFQGYFTATDSSNYRLIFHITTISTASVTYSFIVDNVSVGPEKAVPVESWRLIDTKYLTADQTSSATISDLTFSDLVVGKWYEIKSQWDLITNDTAADALVFVNPTHNGSSIGKIALLNNNGTSTLDEATFGWTKQFQATATTLTFVANSASANSYVNGDNSDGSTWVQLFEKTSSVISTTENVFKNTYLRYSTNAAQSIANNDNTQIVLFEDQSYDNVAAYNTSTGVFTAPASSLYSVSAFLTYTGSTGWDENESAEVRVYVNGAQHSVLSRFTLFNQTASQIISTGSGTDIVYLNKGDTLDIRAFQNSGAAISLFNVNNYNYMSIHAVKDTSVFGLTSTKKKTQTKLLTANVTTDTTITDLSYTGLTVGQWYAVHGQFQFSILSASGGQNISVTASENSNTVGLIGYAVDMDTGTGVPTVPFYYEFQATGTTLTFSSGSVGSDSILGSSSKGSTFVTLTEIEPLTTTTEW